MVHPPRPPPESTSSGNIFSPEPTPPQINTCSHLYVKVQHSFWCFCGPIWNRCGPLQPRHSPKNDVDYGPGAPMRWVPVAVLRGASCILLSTTTRNRLRNCSATTPGSPPPKAHPCERHGDHQRGCQTPSPLWGGRGGRSGRQKAATRRNMRREERPSRAREGATTTRNVTRNDLGSPL